LIEVQEIKDKQPLDAPLVFEEYAWILFTSAHGVAFFVERWIKTEDRVSARPAENLRNRRLQLGP